MEAKKSLYSGMIDLGFPGDLTVKIVAEEENDEGKAKVALVHVSRAIMLKNSDYFRRKLRGSQKRNARERIKLKVAYVESAMVWFRRFHSCLPPPTEDDLIVASHIRGIVDISDKYGFDKSAISEWVWSWAKMNLISTHYDPDFIKAMLYPTFKLGDVDAFSYLTKMVVYGGGRFGHENAIDLDTCGLPMEVTTLLHFARDNILEEVHSQLFKKVVSMLESPACSCQSDVISNYMRELVRIKVWPLATFSEATVGRPIDKLLEFDQIKLETVRCSASFPPTSSRDERCTKKTKLSGCESHQVDWKAIVEHAWQVADQQFEGLCIDCMTTTDDCCHRNHGDETAMLSQIFIFPNGSNGILAPTLKVDDFAN